MPAGENLIVSLAVALGVGLLIGIERERRKGAGPTRAPAGVRTFTLTSLVGALSLAFGGTALLAVAAGVLGLLVVVAYLRSPQNDPGMTTEIALLITLLLGAVAVEAPAIATGLGVSVAILLAARSRMHAFVSSVITEDEFHDALILAGAAMVVLPLLPDKTLGPFGAFNPRLLWQLAVLMMALGATGHVAMRALGPRYGLPLAGLASGFVSSTATIASMGAKSKAHPALHAPAVAAAVLSSVATVAQLFLVVGVVSRPALAHLALPLGAAGAIALVYGAIFILRSSRAKGAGQMSERRAFDPRTALLFTATLAAVMIISSAMNAWFGQAALAVTAGVAGLADAHAAAVSVANVTAAGKLAPADAAVPVLTAFTTNTVSKLIVAKVNGDAAFFWQIAPGLLLMAAAAWGVELLTWFWP